MSRFFVSFGFRTAPPITEAASPDSTIIIKRLARIKPPDIPPPTVSVLTYTVAGGRSRLTVRFVCVLKTAPQFTAIRPCVWAGAPGGPLCVLQPRGEIAVNTFHLLSAPVGSGKQSCSVHYPPPPPRRGAPRHIYGSTATFTSPARMARRRLLFPLSFSSFFPSLCIFSFISPALGGKTKLVPNCFTASVCREHYPEGVL